MLHEHFEGIVLIEPSIVYENHSTIRAYWHVNRFICISVGYKLYIRNPKDLLNKILCLYRSEDILSQ